MIGVKENKFKTVKGRRKFKCNTIAWRTHDYSYDWQYSIARYQLTGKIINP